MGFDTTEFVVKISYKNLYKIEEVVKRANSYIVRRYNHYSRLKYQTQKSYTVLEHKIARKREVLQKKNAVLS